MKILGKYDYASIPSDHDLAEKDKNPLFGSTQVAT